MNHPSGTSRNPRRLPCCFLLIVLAVLLPASPAQNCSPPVLHPTRAHNLFDEQQEYDLGEILAEHISISLHVIEDEAVAGRLQEIGNRLVANMPPTKIRFRFFVIDSPAANALALPGGRVYVTRRLITTVRSEDELAGVLGHEMGHALAHDQALDISRVFADMGITQIADRSDIEDKYNQFLDTYRIHGWSRPNVEHEQGGADQVALYAVARAGYIPQAVVEYWDRYAETKGKQGNWMTDLLSSTRPESKRLREFVHDLASLPAGCIQPIANPAAAADFAHWQLAVKNYAGFGKKESLHKVQLKQALNPTLRADIRNFRFSPDGKYLLAQDSSSIFVLTREPLANLFRIDAPGAEDAAFSPDSHFVVFSPEWLKVERWNIAEQHLEDVHELYVRGGCVQSAVSPDGDYLGCLRPDPETYFPLTFTLYDLSTGDPVFTKKDLLGPLARNAALWSAYSVASSGQRLHFAMAFSPDGHYFVLGEGTGLMVYLRTLSAVKMPGALRNVTESNFAFVGPGKVVGTDPANRGDATVVSFPSGEIVTEHIHLGGRKLYPVTQGDLAIVRPVPQAPLGVIDLNSKQLFRISRNDAIDTFGDALASERANGEVALYRLKDEKPFATLVLPSAPLGHLSAFSVAAGAAKIAFSQMSRGAVWDLKTGEQVARASGFRGAFFGPDDKAVYLDMEEAEQFRELPNKGDSPADVRRREADKPGDFVARVDFSAHSTTSIFTLKKRTGVRQIGSVVLTSTPGDDERPGKDVTLEARDVQTGNVLWSRFFAHGLPTIDSSPDSDDVVFAWSVGTKRAKDELSEDPEAKQLVSALKEENGSYLVEVVNLRTGKRLGKFTVETGRNSLTARGFLATSGTVAMLDSNKRASLYSYTGEKKGRLFAFYAAVSHDGKRLCIEREPGRLVLYDIEGLKEVDEMTFGSRVSYVGFTPDSSQLVVLTADQTAYVFPSEPGATN